MWPRMGTAKPAGLRSKALFSLLIGLSHALPVFLEISAPAPSMGQSDLCFLFPKSQRKPGGGLTNLPLLYWAEPCRRLPKATRCLQMASPGKEAPATASLHRANFSVTKAGGGGTLGGAEACYFIFTVPVRNVTHSGAPG